MSGGPPQDRIDDLTPEERRALLQRLLREKQRRESAQERPVSFAQRRLWFLDQLAEDGAFSNTPVALRLLGDLDVDVLRRVLDEIVARHETLRTTFAERDGEPVQMVAPPRPLELDRLDLSADPEPEPTLRRTARDLGGPPFDLQRGPLLRARLVKLPQGEHVLLLAVHHIVYDGWSNDIVVRELSTLYDAFLAGRPSPLAPLPIQYGDYAAWQAEHLTGDILERLLTSGRERLSGTPNLELPTDHPRPPVQQLQAAKLFVDVPEHVALSLEAISRAQGATLFMTALATLKVLLLRITGQEDLVVGTPIAGRSRSETEGVVGCFINTVVLRNDLSGDPTFRELVTRVRDTSLEAFDHGELPFERLVEELKPERDLSRNPVFQMLFMLQEAGAGMWGGAKQHAEAVDGLHIRPYELDSGTTRLDLEAYMFRTPSGMRVLFNYSTALFEQQTVQNMLRWFAHLLQGIADDADRPISTLPLMDEAERRAVLTRWNGTTLPLSPAPNLAQAVAEQVARTPDAPAASFGTETLSYRELKARTSLLAQQLGGLGLGPGDLLGLHLERGLPMLVAVLAVLESGAAYVPLDPGFPSERLRFMAEDAHLAAVLTDAQQDTGLSDLVPCVVTLDATGAAPVGAPVGAPVDAPVPGPAPGPPTAVGFDDLAYILYTSGSTGRPKGVRISHGAALNLLFAMAQQPGLEAHDVFVAVTTLSFDISFLELLLPLTVGARVVIASREEAADGERLAALLDGSGATALQATPATWRLLLASGWAGRQGLKALVGGEAWGTDLAHPLLERCGSLWNMYGPTETTVWSAVRRIHSDDTRILVGTPIANTTLYVLDPAGEPVPAGVAGELFIGGEGLAQGYHGRPELTAERFIPDPFGTREGNRLYRTGDRVRQLRDGALQFLGRLDAQVKLRGYRIELGEIETVLAAQSGVDEAAAAVREDSPGDPHLVAYIVSADPPEPTLLRAALREHLPEYMVPGIFVTLDALPRTPNGKLDRNALPAPDAADLHHTTEYEAPRGMVEELLAELWADVLHIESVGAHDNFFERGGHSLLATRLVSRIRDAFDVELPLAEVFTSATLGELATRITELRSGEAPQLPKLAARAPGTEPRPSLQQVRLWFLDQLEPGSGAYNMPLARRMLGTLDVQALQRGLTALVARHEVLHCVFEEHDGDARVRLVPPADIELPIEDLSQLGEEALAETLRDRVQAQTQRPFDLEAGPLLRASLLQLGPEHHVFQLTMHHIVSDALSLEVVFRELAETYAAAAEGREAALPPLALQYADYADWQRTCFESDLMERELNWWRDTLRDAPPAIELPCDRPRPSDLSSLGARETATLDESTVRALRRLGQDEGASLFMVLLAAFKVLLMRTTGAQDIVVGTPVSGRTHTAMEPLVGFFINTLVLRNDLSGAPTFRELVRRVRHTTLDAFTHQLIPFEKLVEELQPRRDPGRNPIFQVFVNMLDVSESGGLSLPDLQVEPVGGLAEHSKFDLTLYLFVRGDEVSTALAYNVDLFEPATVRSLLNRFSVLLSAIATDAECPVTALPLLSEEERLQVAALRAPDLVQQGFTPFTEDQVELPIGQRFAAQVERSPERIAIRTETRAWTYADLDARSRSIGATLAGVIHGSALGAAGAPAGDELSADEAMPQRVVLLVERGELSVAAALGVLRAGHAYVPLDPGYPEPWLRDVIADTRPAVLLTDTAHLDLARSLAKSMTASLTGPAAVLDVEGPLAVGDVVSGGALQPTIDGPISPDALAYIRYTSGSTGRPKGVMQSHRGLAAHIRAYTNSLHIDASDRLSGLASFTHDAGLMDAYGALLNGASWCPWPLRQRSPAEAVDALESLGITIYHSTPSAFRHLFEGLPAERTLPSVRLVVFGGEAPRVSDLQLFRQHFHEGCLAVNGLGSSESSQVLQAFFDHTTPADRPRVPVGQPIDGTAVVLLDAEGRETDVLGEIGVRSDHIALGYWERPEQTAAVFSPEPTGRGSVRLYRSGDLARRLPDGRLEWLGRLDDQVEIRGYRVEPGEVSAALAALPGVDQAAVVPRETPAGELGLVGYVVPAEGAPPPEPAALLQELRARLPEHMHPALLVPLDALPTTPGGKLDRRALPDPEWGEVQRVHAYRAPTTASEQRLAQIFAEVLGVEQVGADDHFFELGGHSLLATRIVSRVRDALHVELPLADIFAEPRLAGLAARLDALLEGKPAPAAPPLVVADRPENPEPSFQQLRVWFLDKLEPGSGAYNMPLARSLRGALDVEALRSSFDTLVARHETLRSTFPSGDGRPHVRIANSLALELPVEDLCALAPGEREEAVSAAIKADAQEPFDLAHGPLIRASLLKLAEDEHVLLLCIHHIVCDAGSMELFFRELAICYAATVEQQPAELPALAVQYADYADWQHRCLQSHVLDDQLAWWRETLGDDVAALELPLDRPRPELQQSVGARETVEVDEQTVRALRRLGQQESASLFMVLLAAFKTLLMRTTGSTDVVVGTPVSGRNHTEVEPLVGFFINTLVLRNDLSGAPTFRELVRGVRQSTLDAFAHQDIPFEKLVEELKPRRDLGRNPLFDVFVNMVELSDSTGFELPGLASEPVGEMREHAKFDLTLYLLVRGDALWLRLAYNTQLFERSTVQGLLDRFGRLLEGAARDADQALGALPLLAADERARLAAARGKNPVTHEAPTFEARQTQQSIAQRFARQVATAPDSAAVRAEGFTWTYASLDRRAEAAALAVQRAVAATSGGNAEPQRVVLLVESGAHALAGALGVLRAGHAYVPLDPSYPEAWLRDVCRDIRPAAVLTDHAHAALGQRLADEAASQARAPGTVVDIEDLVLDTTAAHAEPEVSPAALAYIRYTSGSTGRPKGVMQSHRGLLEHIRAYTNSLRIGPDDRLSGLASFTHDAGLMDAYGAVLNGACWCPWPLRQRSPDEAVDALESLGVTIYHSTPTAFRHLFDGLPVERTLRRVRLVVFGGEAPRVADLSLCREHFEPRCLVVNGLGSSESSQSLQAFFELGAPFERPRLPVGYPIEGTEMVLLDAEGRETDVLGEIGLRSDHIALGYWEQPEETAAVFSPEAPGQGCARLYRSGDLARRLPDGSLEWLGRIDDQLEIRGYRVEPGEVVAALTALPEVAQAAVVPRRSPTGELRLVGYVVPAEGAESLELGDLLLALREQLPEQSLPATLVQLGALPSTPGGKLDRVALPEPAWTEAQRARAYREPVTGTEERLAEIFAGVLGLERVGADDHFFEVGGHSLLATQVVSRILSSFSVELPLAEMFELPTVARIAACIDTMRWSRGDASAAEGAESTGVQPAPAGVPPTLSFGQERFWFLHQLQPDSAAHILHAARHLEGPLDHDAMERALTAIVSRHAVLRCTFPESEDGEPTCVVAEPSPVPVERTDLSALKAAAQRARVKHIAAHDSRTPFDIARGPLLRAHVLRLSPTSHVFLFSMHHMLGDAWSMGVFWREFGALYSAESSQQATPLEALPLQYTDFAHWQRERLSSGDGAPGRLDELLGYWTEQLKGAPPLLDLPTDRPRPAIEAFAGARMTRTLDPELTSALNACAMQHDVTLFMLLHAGFSELLHRYAGQTDIVLGVPVAGRLRAEFEDLIGLFVNSICLRADLSGNPSFAELLQRSRVTSLGGFAHQEMPFERLVQELRPTRALSHHPLFQVMLVLQNAPRSGAHLPGLEMSAAGTQRLTSQFDLTLFVWESGGHIALTAEYKTGLFDTATVDRMLEHLECLLRGAVAAPNRPVCKLPLLGESERQRVLLEWNSTDAPLPECTTLHQLFRRQAEATPDSIAVTFAGDTGDAQLTYAELSSAASRFARRLRAEGMRRGSRVGLCLDRGLPMVEALLGILEVGAAYVPLDPTHPADRLRFVIEDAQLDGLVIQPDYLQLLDVRDVPILFMDAEATPASGQADTPPDDGPDAEDLAYVIYTSGSTGRPKGVELTHRSVVNFLTSMHRLPGITADDVFLSVTTLSFDIAVLELFGPLTIGARVVLAPSEVASDGARLEALLSRTRATVCQATPSTWRLLLEARWPGDRRLKILCGGEAWSRALADELLPRCASLWNMYGPTETTVWSAVQQVEVGDAPVAIGAPIANTQLYVLDATDQPVPLGVPGELHIGGTGLARGYWNREELTAERFVPDLLGPAPGGRLYRTGDLVRRRADGTMDFLGRIDHQVKVQGFRIELGEIETVLGDHAEVHEVVVTAHEYGPDDTRLVAYIVPEANPAPTGSDLRAALRDRLPDYMVPGVFMMLEELPRTPNGKLDRNALPEPAPTRRAESEETVLPSTPVELTLADIWKDLLKIEEISVLDNFFDLGGHSLLAMRVVARLEHETGVRINPGELIMQTLGQVAAAAERSLPEATATPAETQTAAPVEPAPVRRPAGAVPRTPSVPAADSAPEAGGKLKGWARKLLGRNRPGN